MKVVTTFLFIYFTHAFVSVHGFDVPPYLLIDGCKTLTTSSTLSSLACNECYKGFDLTQTGLCTYNRSICISKAGGQCTINLCIYEDYKVSTNKNFCVTCASPYSAQQSIYTCNYPCQINSSYPNYISQATDCKPKCSQTNCLRCAFQKELVCLLCSSEMILFNDRCIPSCPDGYYYNSSIQTCSLCSSYCTKCISQHECTVCTVSSTAIPPACECPIDQQLYKATCIPKCLYQYQLNTSGVCEKICKSEYTYPLFNSDGSFSSCVTFTDSNNSYCESNLLAMNSSDNVQFTLQKQLDNTFHISVILNQTPKGCYDVKFFEQNSSQISKYTEENRTESYFVSFAISQTQIDSNLIECTQSICNLNLCLFWINQLQYVYKVKVDLSTSSVLSTNVWKVNQNSAIDVACHNCTINRETSMISTISAKCTVEQTCSESLMTAPVGSILEITQIVASLSTSMIMPVSIQIINMSNQSFLISEYTYDNTILGQITYKFKAIPLLNGNLILTSMANSRILDYVQSEEKRVFVANIQINVMNKECDSFVSIIPQAILLVITTLGIFATIIVFGVRFIQKTRYVQLREETINHEVKNESERRKEKSQDIEILQQVSTTENTLIKTPVS